MVSDWENRVARGDFPPGPMTPIGRDEINRALGNLCFEDNIVFGCLRSTFGNGTERELFVAMVTRLAASRKELLAKLVEAELRNPGPLVIKRE
jgi:hypothetical protein